MIADVRGEMATYQPINSESTKNLQSVQKNLKASSDFINTNTNDLESHFHYLAAKINRQLIGILKDKHQIQLIKIQQMHAVSTESKKRVLQEVLDDLDKNISYVDFEFEEMREQQLHVDLFIEEYFKKIDQYPKSLKKLFDMGTQLLQLFEIFYQKWYFFQCEVQ